MVESRGQTNERRMDVSLELRAINIKGRITIFKALEFIGVELIHGENTQQIICPFHDDSKPSARAYGDSNKLFCFTCHKMWDVINVVMDGKRLSFLDAVTAIEVHFKLESPLENLPLTIKYNMEKATSAVPSLTKLREYAEERLIEVRHQLGLEIYVKYLYAMDLSRFYFESKKISDKEHRDTLRKLVSKLPSSV